MFLRSIFAIAIVHGATVGAHAAPVDATSDLMLSHSWVVNDGSTPLGIDILSLSSTLELDRDAASYIDSPTAVLNDDIHVQVGNPFSDPPLPAEGAWNSVTVDLVNGDFARGFYSTSITTEDEGDHSAFDPVRRSVVQEGAAALAVAAGDVAASGSAQEIFSRSYAFENTTDELISFELSGMFEAVLEASASGIGTFAQAAGGFEVLFETGDDASVSYIPAAPYLNSVEDSASGASVTEQLLLSSGGISGVSFGATVTAIGDDSDTSASFMGSSSYFFGLSLEPGAVIRMATSHRQFNTVEFDPDLEVPEVPLPASAVLLLGGLLALTRLGRASA